MHTSQQQYGERRILYDLVLCILQYSFYYQQYQKSMHNRVLCINYGYSSTEQYAYMMYARNYYSARMIHFFIQHVTQCGTYNYYLVILLEQQYNERIYDIHTSQQLEQDYFMHTTLVCTTLVRARTLLCYMHTLLEYILASSLSRVVCIHACVCMYSTPRVLSEAQYSTQQEHE